VAASEPSEHRTVVGSGALDTAPGLLLTAILYLMRCLNAACVHLRPVCGVY
jgi:hypothetical protein